MIARQKGALALAAFGAAAIGVGAADASPLADPSIGARIKAGVALAQTQQSEPDGLFQGVGVVTAVDAATGSLTLNHDEIKGLMPAMEMMYRIDPRSLSDGLRPGDRIDFTVDAKTYTIRSVKLIDRAR